ncbi:carbohydrate-binding module family 35 protein [Venturia nashicola]|uniref:Alpha-galactosidase n=1 Tax=Venturia nashicola TaxID=86259 RepID=A0A4Z1PFS8_9PEZI|nr:carbohydrate-binding module family 35 protein [Venturia nashicola]TLD36700.1 carbohydrate-binding module family 35 protein [Venturia nashicola]
MFLRIALKHSLLSISVVFSYCNAVASKSLQPRLNNGLALKPIMGWNSYNHYSCSPNESIIHSNAQALVDLGLQAVGYHFVTVDCGWTLPNRSDDGTLTPNPARFPSGYPALSDFIHGLGLGFGVYSDAGVKMCMTGQPEQVGSLYHEKQDAETFASWGADLLKYDNCFSEASSGFPNTDYAPTVPHLGRYQNMSDAIASTKRPIIMQLCNWGLDFPSAWAPQVGHSWRITNDIIPAWRTIPRILNQAVPQTSFAGAGHWLDLDMLEVGNDKFTIPEEQTHFSLWAIIKSPLVIGAALKDSRTSIKKDSLDILMNKDVIGYNQDSLGVAASFRRRWTEEGYEIWAGPLSGNRLVVAVINWSNKPRDLTLNFSDVDVDTAGSLKDIWNDKTASNVQSSYTAHVQAHGTILLELSEITKATASAQKPTFFPSTDFTIIGSANRQTCQPDLCAPVGSKIGYLSPSGSASIEISSPSTAAKKLVDVYFCNNEIAFQSAWAHGTNTRNLTISVNDVTTRIEVPLSGKSSELFSVGKGWEDTGTFKVEVGGWKVGTNKVIISNKGGRAGLQKLGADFVGMDVYF